MLRNVLSSNPPPSNFAQASCQAASLCKKEFYGQILHISVLCKKAPWWPPWRLGFNYGLHSSWWSPAHAEPSSRSFSQYRVWWQGIYHVLILKYSEMESSTWRKSLWRRYFCGIRPIRSLCLASTVQVENVPLNRNISSPLGLNTDENFKGQILRWYKLV